MTTLEFRVDFFYLMQYLQFKGNPTSCDVFDHAVVDLLLFQWGLTIEEVDEAHRLAVKKAENNQLGNVTDAIVRLTKYASEDVGRKMQLVADLATVVSVQKYNLTDAQKNIVDGFQGLLDVRPSEFQFAINRGIELAAELAVIGHQFAAANRIRANPK